MRRQPCSRPKLWPTRIAGGSPAAARGQRARPGTGPQAAIEDARQDLGLSPADLWTSYASLGGREPAETIRRFLQGRAALLAPEYDLLIDALVDEGRRRDMLVQLPHQQRPGQ
jgi:FMN phosphatase YigB (HAD superfamily)